MYALRMSDVNKEATYLLTYLPSTNPSTGNPPCMGREW